jgi:hypothetical protein
MTVRASRAGLALLAALSLLAGCSRTLPQVQVENGTDIPLAVHVNGEWLGTYPAGAVADVAIRAAGPPWSIDVRSGSGATLTSLAISADDLQRVDAGTRSLQATADTPCGTIRLTFGDAAIEPLPFSTSPPGPCP